MVFQAVIKPSTRPKASEKPRKTAPSEIALVVVLPTGTNSRKDEPSMHWQWKHANDGMNRAGLSVLGIFFNHPISGSFQANLHDNDRSYNKMEKMTRPILATFVCLPITPQNHKHPPSSGNTLLHDHTSQSLVGVDSRDYGGSSSTEQCIRIHQR